MKSARRLPAEGGRQAAGRGSEAQSRGRGQTRGGSKAVISLGLGVGKEPAGRDVPQGWEGPTVQKDMYLSLPTKRSSPYFPEASFVE